MNKRQFKIIIVGDSAVGKTSLLEQFVSEKFSALYKPTIGTDFMCKEVYVGKTVAKLQIWDTAGQETWCSQMGVAYYRGADACVFVYDITSSQSLTNVTKWYQNFVQCTGEASKRPMFLVGNKLDRINNVDVSDASVKQMCSQLNISPSNSYKCSAKTGDNVQQCFQHIAEVCVDECRQEKQEQTIENFVIRQTMDPQQKKKGCC